MRITGEGFTTHLPEDFSLRWDLGRLPGCLNTGLLAGGWEATMTTAASSNVGRTASDCCTASSVVVVAAEMVVVVTEVCSVVSAMQVRSISPSSRATDWDSRPVLMCSSSLSPPVAFSSVQCDSACIVSIGEFSWTVVEAGVKVVTTGGELALLL